MKNPTVVRLSAAFDAFQIEPRALRVALAKAIEGGARLRQKVDTRTTVYGTAGMPVKSGRGLFAHALVTRFSLRPVEEEGRLNDPRLRENFVERIFAYRRLRALVATRWSMGTVVRFHTAHKLTLMAHMPEAYQRLGRLVASGKSMARREFQDRYSSPWQARRGIARSSWNRRLPRMRSSHARQTHCG